MSSKQAALDVFRAVDTAFEVKQPAQDDPGLIPSKWDGAREGGEAHQKRTVQRDARELLEVPRL
jgi:hypothetical protein